MQNSNTTFNPVRTPTQDNLSQDSDDLNLVKGLSFEALPLLIENHNLDEKIRLIIKFLQVGEKENITCENFAKMVSSLGIIDANKMELITEFLGSNKVLITSIETNSFAELQISDEKAKETLSIIKDAFNEKNNIMIFCQIFSVFKSIFESEGLRVNIVEKYIINSQDSIIDQEGVEQEKVKKYLIEGASITNPNYIGRINSALQEIYPTKSPLQSNAGSQAGAPETEPTLEEIRQLRAALEFESTDSSDNSHLLKQERLFQLLNNKNPSREERELRGKIEKWLSESETTSSERPTEAQQNHEITRSSPRTQSSPQRQEPEPQPNSGTATQGQRISPSKATCCTIS